MKSGDLKVAWNLAAPEASFYRGSESIAFFTQYAEHLSMVGCFW